MLSVLDYSIADPFDRAVVSRTERRNLVILFDRGSADSTAAKGESYVDLTDLGPGIGDSPPARSEAAANVERLREEFLHFLDRWPRTPLFGKRSFDDLFRQATGDSVWWTGPALDRHPSKGAFTRFQQLRALVGALETRRPTVVQAFTTDESMATAIASTCAGHGIACHFVGGSALPKRRAPFDRSVWAVRSLWHLITRPFSAARLALVARRASGRTRQPRGSVPAIVLASRLHRYFRASGDRLEDVFWAPVVRELAVRFPGVPLHYLVRQTQLSDVRPGQRHGGWHVLRNDDRFLPHRDRFVAFPTWLTSLPRNLLAILRYPFAERRILERGLLRVGGADLSALYIPRLREAIRRMPDWSMEVAAVRASLRFAGPIRALLVAEEFYRPTQPELVAARSLGIPTIGIQHGTVMPAHLIYRLPTGQLESGAVPDWFAAYGEYAAETLSKFGAYPRERVLLVGAPRLDRLADREYDPIVARTRLGLPVDRRVILVAGQTFSWFPRALRAVLETARDHQEWLVCLKPHPKPHAMSPDDYIALGREVGAEFRLFRDDLDDLLEACEVLVSSSSTTLLEAALLRKRTLCVNLSGESDWYPYVDEGISKPGRSPEQIRDSLESLLATPAPTSAPCFHDVLRRHVGPTIEGCGARALAETIASISA